MKPIVYAMLATLGYAFCVVMVEQKFSKYHSLVLAFGFSATVATVCGSVLFFGRVSGSVREFPVGPALGLMLFVGVMYALSDYLYLSAYTHGGDLFTITCISLSLPVFATAIKYLMTRGLPNGLQVAGYAVILVGVLLLTKGTIASAPPATP